MEKQTQETETMRRESVCHKCLDATAAIFSRIDWFSETVMLMNEAARTLDFPGGDAFCGPSVYGHASSERDVRVLLGVQRRFPTEQPLVYLEICANNWAFHWGGMETEPKDALASALEDPALSVQQVDELPSLVESAVADLFATASKTRILIEKIQSKS